jgi:hypothetical protein
MGLKPEAKKTTDGVAYISTGIGRDSRVNFPELPLKFVFVTKSRAYLADIDVEITPGPTGKPTRIHSTGPWLFVDLPPGNYRVKAKTLSGHEVWRSFSIVKGRVTEVRVQWNIDDEDS